MAATHEQLLAVHRDVMAALVECDRSDELVPRVLAILGRGLGWDIASLWRVEDTVLLARDQWCRAPDIGAALAQATRSVQLRRNEGLPGITWTRDEPMWLRDVTMDPRFARASAARKSNMRSSLLVPVRGATSVLGVLELFRADPEAPGYAAELVALARVVGTFLEKSVVRAKLDETLRFGHDKLARLHSSALIGLAVSETSGRLFEANDAFLHMLQRTRSELEAGEIRWDQMTPSEWHDADAAAIAELEATGVIRALEKEFVRGDGTRIPVLIGCASLGSDNTHLISFVLDVTRQKMVERELARVNAELECRVTESQGELRALTDHLQQLREDTQAQLAREIHDVLGSELTALKLDAAWATRRLHKAPPELDAVEQRLGSMILRIDELISTVRRIATELRPELLDDLGLMAALRSHTREVANRAGIEIILDIPEQLDIDDKRATAVYRVVQELLTNVIRHADAQRINIELTYRGGVLELAVRDDGVGISAPKGKHSLGLLGIRERVRPFDGVFSIARGQHGGSVATLRLPCGER